MTRCVVGIRPLGTTQGFSAESDGPTVWFPSMACLAAVLSEDNRALLRLIRETKPRSLTELAVSTGRRVPNLSRTLRTMVGYGLVELKRQNRNVQPIALATEFLVILD